MTASIMHIPGVACGGCGSPAVTVLSPGTEPERAGDILLSRGEPTRAWCDLCARRAGWPRCWPMERGAMQREYVAAQAALPL